MAHARSDKISCTDTYIHVDKWYKLQVFWADGRDLILTSVAHLRKKAELKVVWSRR